MRKHLLSAEYRRQSAVARMAMLVTWGRGLEKALASRAWYETVR